MVKVLLLGATGFVGGTILHSFKEEHNDVQVDAVVRKEDHVQPIREGGAAQVFVVPNGGETLSHLVSEYGIVINAADSIDPELASALRAGLKLRKEALLSSGVVGTLIHVTGAATFLDMNKEGKFDPSAKQWTDDEEDIRQIKPEMIHGTFDIPLLEASDAGEFNLFVVSPTIVFGTSKGPIPRLPVLYTIALKRYADGTKPLYIGEGSNKAGFVHTEDVASLVHILLERALKSEGKLLPMSAYSHYYLASTFTKTWKEIATLLAKEAHKAGVAPSPEPVSVPFDANNSFEVLFSSSMDPIPKRAFAEGWTPKYTSLDEEELSRHASEALQLLNAPKA